NDRFSLANFSMMRRSGPNVTLKKITGLSFIVALGFVTFVTSEGKSKSLNSSNIGQQESASDKTAEQVYKNIQVLKDLRASDLDGVMTFMSAALGVGCTYCHTNPWESDQKSAKLAARRMIQMTRAINVEHFSGNPAVTCFTCHRGQHNSVPNPPIDFALGSSPDDESSAVKTSLPSTDEVIDNYLRAVGDATAIAAIKTRVSHGT